MVWSLHGKGLLARGAAVGAFLRRCQKLPPVRQWQFQLTPKQTHCWAHQWFCEHLFDNIYKNKLSSPSWVCFDHDSNLWVTPLSLSWTTNPPLYFVLLSCWWRRGDRMGTWLCGHMAVSQGQHTTATHAWRWQSLSVGHTQKHREALW